MGKIKTFIRRYFILSKRLLHKTGFLIILLLVPILVLSMGIAARNGDSGVVSVALAMQNDDDKIASEIVDKLVIDEHSLIRFVLCDSPASATALVEDGTVDAAWIFKDDIEESITKFVSHAHKNNAFVLVVQREDSVFLRLSHEKLNSALYPYISMSMYSNYLLDNVVYISELSSDELEEFYLSVNAEGADLFEFVYADSDNSEDSVVDTADTNFLVSPLRGLLAIMIVFGGIAVAMFYMQDESRGTFDRLPRGTGFSFSVVFHAAAVIMVAAVVFIALIITNITVSLSYELLALLIYCTCTVGFCMCLRLVLRDIRLFGSVAPILIVVMAVLCPIFFKAPNFPLVQYLLPTYYYIRAFSSTRFIWYMAIYSVILYALAFVLHTLRAERRR